MGASYTLWSQLRNWKKEMKKQCDCFTRLTHWFFFFSLSFSNEYKQSYMPMTMVRAFSWKIFSMKWVWIVTICPLEHDNLLFTKDKKTQINCCSPKRELSFFRTTNLKRQFFFTTTEMAYHIKCTKIMLVVNHIKLILF